MLTTTNYGLKKPEGADIVDIQNFNDNADIIDAKLKEDNTLLSDLMNEISSGNTATPAITYGMNSKITNTAKNTVAPKFTIQGKTVINLLGKDGNCEDTTKWYSNSATLTLDTTNKVFGVNGIKSVLTSTTGGVYNFMSKYNIDVTKYYLISAYVKNGNATSINVCKDATGGGAVIYSTSSSDTTKFVRIGLVCKPADLNTGNAICVYATGTSSQYFYIDGIMINEITASEYALGATALLANYPCVDSYSCLQNPYMEVRHDNLVRNGNGEEGVSWWNQQGTSIPSIENGYFKFTDDDLNINEGIYQFIPVKSGSTYSGRAVIKAGTCNAKFTILEVDDYGNQLQATRKDFITSNTTDTLATLTITVSSNISKIGVFILCDGGTGTAYFKEVSLIEGTTAPASYFPCRLERTVLETKLTSDDSITYNNGEVIGTINWKHRTLYGKDYDWAFDYDYTGFKRIAITSYPTNGDGIWQNTIGMKYDGKILPNNNSMSSSSDLFLRNPTNGITYITVSDTDTGWSESINPNNDCVKVFMNGWKSIVTNSGTSPNYFCWVSVVDGSIPSGAISTTVTASSASGQTVITVANGSIFTAGDNITMYKFGGGVVTYTVASVTSTTITLTSNLLATYDTTWSVIKDDFGQSALPLLNWCKNNVAPNYDGYQLHYKLANAEPITDDNCHIHGDIPLLDSGDNYLYLDTGMVLGEVNIPVLATDSSYYRINNNWTSNGTNSWFKYKDEVIKAVYKNGLYETNANVGSYSNDGGHTNGYCLATIAPANFDSNATYAVDYKILVTQAPQIGTISCSYSQDIITALNEVQEEINNKQEHDSILDTIVDLSLYEKITDLFIMGRMGQTGSNVYQARLTAVISHKKVTPIVTINPKAFWYFYPSGPVSVDLSKIIFSLAYLNKNQLMIVATYTGADTTIINAFNNGNIQMHVDLILDCRGRI